MPFVLDTGYRTHRPQDHPGYRTIIIPLAWTAPESPLSIKDLTRHTELSDHPLACPVTAGIGIGIGIGIGTIAKTVRRTRHTLHCRHLSDNNTPSLTADPYGQPPCTPAGLFILWHHYRRPRSRKRPTVASKHLQDLGYLPHPGISGHTSSRSRVSPAESLASLLRSPSSGQQRRLCCQRLQGRPLIWLISQSQTFRGPQRRHGTNSHPTLSIAQFDATLLSAVVQESGRVAIFFLIIVIISSPCFPPALLCSALLASICHLQVRYEHSPAILAHRSTSTHAICLLVPVFPSHPSSACCI